jgi:hypothetical protein
MELNPLPVWLVHARFFMGCVPRSVFLRACARVCVHVVAHAHHYNARTESWNGILLEYVISNRRCWAAKSVLHDLC